MQALKIERAGRTLEASVPAHEAHGRHGRLRHRAFHCISAAAVAIVLAFSVELYVRAAVDDGMQFDLEMWKYALQLKQVSADPRLGHEHRPGAAAHLMGVDVQINSRKLRDREIPHARSPGVLRILMLGDSFTEGWGVPLADTFSKQIEQLYAEHGMTAEAINAGVGNYGTVQEVGYFLSEGHKYQPDIVVLNATFNDAETVPAYRSLGYLARYCYACVFLQGRVDALLRMASLRQPWDEYYLGLYGGGTAAGWLAARSALGELAAYCRQRGIRLLVASLPELHDPAHYRLGAITDLLRQAAEESGAEFVDVLPVLAPEDPAGLWVTPQDMHPNVRAHALIAAALFAQLHPPAGAGPAPSPGAGHGWGLAGR